jgi:hypothetical protein
MPCNFSEESRIPLLTVSDVGSITRLTDEGGGAASDEASRSGETGGNAGEFFGKITYEIGAC